MTNEEDIKKLSSIKKRIKEAETAFSKTYNRVRLDYKYANGVSGGQFSTEDNRVRGESRANFQFPLLDKFIERVVGLYNANPFGIDYVGRTEETMAKARILSGVAKGIEDRSDAQSAYRTALRSSTTAGYGFIHVTTEYDNEEDDSLDVRVSIDQIINPLAVLMDPLSTKIDGSDAEWIGYINHMNPEKAKALYGEEVLQYLDNDSQMFDTTHLQYSKDDVVPLVTFYEKKHKVTTVYFDKEGKPSKKDVGGRSKEKKSCTIMCTKIVGNKIISETDLKIKNLPLIPVYGLPVYSDNRMQYVGIIHRAIDAQRLLNYGGSLGAERLALSPKANYIADGQSIARYQQQWADSARSNIPVLPYDSTTEEGQPLPPPIKQDTAVNIGDVMAMQQNFSQLIASIIGLPQDGYDLGTGRQQTAEEVLLRSKTSESIMSTIFENLESSIKQTARVVMEMVSVNYDTERNVPVRLDGKPANTPINFPELSIMPNEYEVSVSSGPLLSTQRKENLRSYLAIGQLLGPNVGAILPEIASCVDVDDQKGVLKQKMEMISQRMLQGGGEDPAAAMQMKTENDAMRNQIAQMQAAMLQMQQNDQLGQMKLYADLQKNTQDNQIKLEIERMKLAGASALVDQKAAADLDKTLVEQQMKLNQAVAEAEAESDAAIKQALIVPAVGLADKMLG